MLSFSIRPDIKRILTGFVSLLGSSVISAIGFVAIASNRFVSFESSLAVFLILFVQWQTLGLTIAKTGMEQVVFALVSENDKAYFSATRYVFRTALPLTATFSLCVLFTFSPWAAAVAFGTIMLDTWSLIIMADLNARQKFITTAFSNLLNYPLFFIVIFLLNHFGELSKTSTLAVFLGSSCIRWLWLLSNQPARAGLREVVSAANVQMGLQQALNYMLFRADQIALAILGLKMQQSESAGMYLFLAKFPELVSGVMVVVGTVFFPRMYLKYPFDLQTLINTARNESILVAAYVLSVSSALFGYLFLWKGESISPYLVVPFLIHALCIIIVNNVTYSTLRQGYLNRLLTNLTWAVLSGAALCLIVYHEFSIRLLSWLVPIQLLLFIVLSLTLAWGQRRDLYA